MDMWLPGIFIHRSDAVIVCEPFNVQHFQMETGAIVWARRQMLKLLIHVKEKVNLVEKKSRVYFPWARRISLQSTEWLIGI